MASKRPPLTVEQLALSNARSAKKAKQNAVAPTTASLVNEAKGRIMERKWIHIEDADDIPNGHRVKVFTWNVSACTMPCPTRIVSKQQLFESSSAHVDSEEVDRLEKLLPVLESAGYAHRYAAGPNKKHGCLIAFKKDLYEETALQLILYDEHNVRATGEEGMSLRGGTFHTRNIGHIVALKRTQRDEGVVVATTHLFWHPKYVYEKARQAAILKREVVQFRSSIGHEDWPCIISGDFNFTPDDPVYSLLVGDPVLPVQEERLRPSYVVHASIDPAVASRANQTPDNENEEEGADPDKVITNARPAQPMDGLLSLPELKDLFSNSGPPMRSAYDSGLRRCLESLKDPDKPIRTFGDRVTISASRRGGYEIEWSSYTFYWKLVLDYIFIIDAPGSESTITGVLSGHRTEALHPGLPKMGVCGSDHVSLSAEIVFART